MQQQQQLLHGALKEGPEMFDFEAKRERRKSAMSLALPACPDGDIMTASVSFGEDEVEFEAHGVKINHQGLFIEGTNVSEIKQDDLQVLSTLGRGACSVVLKAQHVETRKLYAIKVFSVFVREKRAQLLKEVETLWGMECPSLLSFAGGYLKDGSIHVVLEYMDRGSLADLIHAWQGAEYGEELMAAVAFQILWGLGYLHYENHVHRDIKPQNVLLNSSGEVKLSDFGIARALEGATDLAQTMVGTIRYMSPERLAGEGYGMAADVWSLGVVLLEMAVRKRPFETMASQIELHDKLEQQLIVEDLIKLVPGHSSEFEEVLRGCLQPRPEARLAPEDLLDLQWFSRFRPPADELEGLPPSSVNAQALASCAVEGAATVESHENIDVNSSAVSEAAVVAESLQGECNRVQQDGNGSDAVEGDEDQGHGCERHGLDLATNVTCDFITAAAEKGLFTEDIFSLLPPAPPNIGSNGGGGSATPFSNGGMIQTMYSDGSASDDSIGVPEAGTVANDNLGAFLESGARDDGALQSDWAHQDS